MIYFMNLLLYNKIDTSNLKINVPIISTNKRFELVDVILTLFSLSYLYYGVEDTIVDSRSKIARILGFNMEADLGKIASWLHENHRGLHLKDLHIDTFKIPENGQIMSFDELENIFFTNKDCYDHVIELLNNPPTKEIYDAYRYIYNALMTMDMNMECFLIGDLSIVNEYKALGYKTRFVNIPKPSSYRHREIYESDYAWFLGTIDYTDLCFEVSDNFTENHLLDVYIKESDPDRLTKIGTVQMAYTYQEYLRYADISLYAFINKIKLMADIESRQEACVNAIQTIVSNLKSYIDQTGDDAIPLDTVFSGLPSISIDFIKRYITEVIDFFKSFKIFTHESSIVYVIQDRFENYVQLIDHILLKYLLDKSELVRIEDAIGKITPSLTPKEVCRLIDKVWFEISTWLKQSYSDYYNSDQYEEAKDRIKDYLEYRSTLECIDEVLDKRIQEHQTLAIDAILKLLVDITLTEDKVPVEDSIAEFKKTQSFKDYYNEWLIDIMKIVTTIDLDDRILYQDDIIWSSLFRMNTVSPIVEQISNSHISTSHSDKMNISDHLYTIITVS